MGEITYALAFGENSATKLTTTLPMIEDAGAPVKSK